jgi:hypothetical protein
MNIKIAGIIIGLLVAGAPVLAKAVEPAKHAAAPAAPAASAAPVKKPAATTPGAAARRSAKSTPNDAHASAIPATNASVPDAEGIGWQIVDDPTTGARVGLPTKLVPRVSTTRTGSRWASPHGQIQIETFGYHEASLSALFDSEKKAQHREVEHGELKPDSFVISGMQGLKEFIVHVDASGSELRGITILYDQATDGTMGPIATAMANSFQGFPDPNTGPLPGRKRSVEYASAVVVSSRGDLVTEDDVTDGCQSITIAGFGHAERVAQDKTADLALLRLYGARNLNPVPLAGPESQGGELTLVGVADPLAQAGGNAVTSTRAQATAQGIAPGPSLGFAGAAAIDAQGRLAGVVKLNSPAVAGIDGVNLQSSLIPAAAVRAFLAAQGVAPAAGPAPINQSVVRVICVRK